MSERPWLEQGLPDELARMLASAEDDVARARLQRTRLQSRLLSLGIAAAPPAQLAPVSAAPPGGQPLPSSFASQSAAHPPAAIAGHGAASAAAGGAGAAHAGLLSAKLWIGVLACAAGAGTWSALHAPRAGRTTVPAEHRTPIAAPLRSVASTEARSQPAPARAAAALSEAPGVAHDRAGAPRAVRRARSQRDTRSLRQSRPAGDPTDSAPLTPRLRDEARLIDAMHEALPVEPARALELARRHGQAFPDGVLIAERLLLEVEALLATGQLQRAARVESQLARRDPDSIYARRAHRLLAAAREQRDKD